MAEQPLLHKGVVKLGGFTPPEGIRIYSPAHIAAYGGNYSNLRIGNKNKEVCAFNLVPVGQGDTRIRVATPAGIKEIKSYLYMSYYESFTDISDSSDPSHYSFIVGGYTINVYYDNVIGWSSGVLFNSPCSGNIDVYVNEYGIGWVKVLSGLSTGEYYPGGGSSWSGNAGYPCTISRTNLSHQWIPKKINGIQFVAPAGAVTTWGTTLIRISNRTWNKKI